MQLTKNHTYGGGYISLPVSMPLTLPSTIVVKGKTYYLKNEFHISLACVKKLACMVTNINPKTAEQTILDLFKDYTKDHPLTVYKLTKEVRLVTKDIRQTLILTATVDGLPGLFTYINKQLTAQFDVQPAHITLYTLQPDKGIGILNTQEINALTVIVDVPQISDAL